eukprot:PhF_6_TR19437/c0_g1_i1/m.28431
MPRDQGSPIPQGSGRNYTDATRRTCPDNGWSRDSRSREIGKGNREYADSSTLTDHACDGWTRGGRTIQKDQETSSPPEGGEDGQEGSHTDGTLSPQEVESEWIDQQYEDDEPEAEWGQTVGATGSLEADDERRAREIQGTSKTAQRAGKVKNSKWRSQGNKIISSLLIDKKNNFHFVSNFNKFVVES